METVGVGVEACGAEGRIRWCFVCHVVQGNQGCFRKFNSGELKNIASKKTHYTCGAAARFVGLGDCRNRRCDRAPEGVEDSHLRKSV